MEYRSNTGDPYVDPETGTLKNLAGIRDAALLEEYEGEMSIIRQFEFSENPPPSTFDFTHLRRKRSTEPHYPAAAVWA